MDTLIEPKPGQIWRRIKQPNYIIKVDKITKTEITIHYLCTNFKVLGYETLSIKDFLKTMAFDEEMTKLAFILEII